MDQAGEYGIVGERVETKKTSVVVPDVTVRCCTGIRKERKKLLTLNLTNFSLGNSIHEFKSVTSQCSPTSKRRDDASVKSKSSIKFYKEITDSSLGNVNSFKSNIDLENEQMALLHDNCLKQLQVATFKHFREERKRQQQLSFIRRRHVTYSRLLQDDGQQCIPSSQKTKGNDCSYKHDDSQLPEEMELLLNVNGDGDKDKCCRFRGHGQ